MFLLDFEIVVLIFMDEYGLGWDETEAIADVIIREKEIAAGK